MFNWLWVNRSINRGPLLRAKNQNIKIKQETTTRRDTLFVKHPDTPQAKNKRERRVWESERFLSLIHECNYCINSPFL